MGKFKAKLELSLVALTLALVGLSSLQVWASTAANSSPGDANGYQVSPLVDSLTVDRNTTKTVNVYLVNVSNATEYVQTVIDDFTANPNGSGFPAIYLNGQRNLAHGLQQFASAVNPDFILQPKQSETVPIRITVPSFAASGGYYGAIRFAPQGVNTSKNVNVGGSVAALILITVPGNLKESISVVGFGAADAHGNTHTFFTSNRNIEGMVRIENTGNVQLQPYGNIVLKKGNKELSANAINVNSGNVLPGTQRYFTTSLKNMGSIGIFKLIGNFAFNNTGQLVTATATFYIIPTWLYVLAIVLLVIIILAIIYLVRWLNRRPAKLEKT